jgi:hypothetical protein
VFEDSKISKAGPMTFNNTAEKVKYRLDGDLHILDCLRLKIWLRTFLPQQEGVSIKW